MSMASVPTSSPRLIGTVPLAVAGAILAAIGYFVYLIFGTVVLSFMGPASTTGAPSAPVADIAVEDSAESADARPSVGPPSATWGAWIDGTIRFVLRVGRDPINLLSFIAFGISCGILAARRWNLRTHAKAFERGWFETEENKLILPDDARDLRKRLRGVAEAPGDEDKLYPVRLLGSALTRVRAEWSMSEAVDAVKTKSEIVAGEIESQYGLVRYLAWAIPSIGFIGTVYGLGMAIGAFRNPDTEQAMPVAVGYLFTAFDTTLIGLFLSLILMALFYTTQSKEDALLVKSVERCLDGFALRMHTPDRGA